MHRHVLTGLFRQLHRKNAVMWCHPKDRTHPCCHSSRWEPGNVVLKINPSNTNNIHLISWIVQSSERQKKNIYNQCHYICWEYWPNLMICLFLPIEWAIIANSRYHNHLVGCELPNLVKHRKVELLLENHILESINFDVQAKIHSTLCFSCVVCFGQ